MNTTKGSFQGTIKSTTGIDPKGKFSYRKNAVITGVVLIIATLMGPILATPLLPDLTGTDYLTRVSAHPIQAAAGVLLSIIGYLACAGIAVVMYPVLKKWNAGMALGSVVFRTIETVFYMVGLMSLMSLLTLGQQFTTAAAADRTSLQAIGNLLESIRDHAALLAVFAFCLGAFMYYFLYLPIPGSFPDGYRASVSARSS